MLQVSCDYNCIEYMHLALLQEFQRSSATAEIARDTDDAIQGHSKSSVVVPIEAAYMTSY